MSYIKNVCVKSVLFVILMVPVFAGAQSRYAIVVKSSTLSNSDWAEVVDTLVAKYDGRVFTYSSSISETKAQVAEFIPDFIAFVAPIPEPTPSFVKKVWPYTRELDSDPYGDAVWGIVTGVDAADALRIVSGPRHLDIKTMLGGTVSCNVNYFPQGISTLEGTDYGIYYVKYPDSVKTVKYTDGPRDRTKWLVDMINGDSLIFGDTVDIFVTSGHGSSNSWQMHYGSPNYEGFFRSSGNGYLYGDPYSGSNIPIVSSHPKIYFGLGNCNIGQINNAGCMAPAWIHSGGAYLYTGYVITEGRDSYQHGSAKAYFCLQDHYSWPKAFFIGNLAYCFDIRNNTPGIPGSRDYNASALYGDPGLDARVPDEGIYDTLLYTPELIVNEGTTRDTITFKITMNKEGKPGFSGSKWGYRSPIYLFPFRVDSVEVISTDAIKHVIMDNFVLMYIWYKDQPSLSAGTQRYVTFTAIRTHIGTEERHEPSPVIATLCKSYPNPFLNITTIKYNLIGNNIQVSLKIYDITGKLVRTLVNETRNLGVHTTQWDGKDDSGNQVTAGVYFCRLTAGDSISNSKLIVLR